MDSLSVFRPVGLDPALCLGEFSDTPHTLRRHGGLGKSISIGKTCFSILMTLVLSWCSFEAHAQPLVCDPPAPAYNDPSSQDGILEKMNIPCAWTITNGDPNIAVAVFDSYLDNAHDDLVGKVIELVGTCNPELANYSHGLQSLGAVAGIRNNWCIAGSGGLTKVAGWCSLASTTTMTAAMNSGYKIMSVSAWGSLNKTLMEALTDNDVTVLLAGLHPHHQASDPNGLHSVPGVIHVGRAYQSGAFYSYFEAGNTGPNMNMDVLVVTQGLHGLKAGNTCGPTGEGTSIGTPLLAGVVALMKSVNPCLFPGDIEEILVQTAAPANDPATRAGVIDAYAAVLEAQNFQGIDKTWSGTQDITYAQVSGDLTILSGADIRLLNRLKTGSESRIIIESGAKFTVLGTIEMGQMANIIVKRGAEFIVDGGKITTHDCAEQWGRIYVEGNNEKNQQIPGDVMEADFNGVLYLKDAILENGHTFIDMAAFHIPWPERPEYYGGHVTAENTTFINTKEFTNYTRVAAFMQYKFDDESKFSSCIIKNMTAGMTHWNNFGTRYEKCTFEDYDHAALITYDAQIEVVNGNSFDNGAHTEFNQSAIDLYQTCPIPIGSIIGSTAAGVNEPNLFFGGFHQLFSDGGNPLFDIRVENNIFTGGQYSVRFDGISRHSIHRNDMIGPVFGSTLVANGDEIYNTLSDNQFSNNGVGLFTFFNNSNTDFLKNCFDYSARTDVRLDQGVLLPNIGNKDVAASNIFSSLSGARRIEITGFPVSPSAPAFQYHILQGTSSTDRTAPRIRGPVWNGNGYSQTDVSSTFNAYDSDDFADPECGSITTPGPVDTNPYNCNLPSEELLEAFIADLKEDIAVLEAQLSSLTQFSAEWFSIRYQITAHERCLQQANNKLIFFQGKVRNYTPLITRFQSDKFLYRTYVYGMMVHNQDYSEASDYLAVIGAADEEQQDFVTIQEINLDRLKDLEYVPDSSVLSTVYTVGLKVYPMSGYARSLYRLFTGERLELELDYSEDDPVVAPRSTTSRNLSDFKIWPNPTEGELNIEAPIGGIILIQMHDLHGRNMFSQSVSAIPGETITLNVSDVPEGLYFLSMYDTTTKRIRFSTRVIIAE